MPGMQVENWATAATAAGGGGSQIQWVDRNEVWAHEPRLDDVLETTDIWRFPESGLGPYRVIFVFCQCFQIQVSKWYRKRPLRFSGDEKTHKYLTI